MSSRNLHVTSEDVEKFPIMDLEASIDIEGITLLATEEETIDGLIDNKVVTPLILRKLFASMGIIYGLDITNGMTILNGDIGTPGVPFDMLNDIPGPIESLNGIIWGG